MTQSKVKVKVMVVRKLRNWLISVCLLHPRMYIYILLDTVMATDINKYSLASARCQPIWRTHLANWI